MKGVARFQTSIASLQFELHAVSRIARKNIALLPKTPYLRHAVMEQLADYDISHNIEVLGGRSGTPYDAFTLATNAKKIRCACRYFRKKIIFSWRPTLFCSISLSRCRRSAIAGRGRSWLPRRT